jgi:broad specificity phosphatase PhoE
MNRLYWVRHGENLANITKEFSYKIVDYPLTPKGVLQAQQTAEYLADKHIHEIYASPLKRAVETAEIIAARLRLPVTVMENFREVNVGQLEGVPGTLALWEQHNQIIADWLSGKPERTFPGGEDYFTLLGRIRAGLQEITDHKTGRNQLVVAHGGNLSFTLKDWCKTVDAEWIKKHPTENCSISEILLEWQGDQVLGQLVSWASYTHLHSAAAEFVSAYVNTEGNKP